ncbi:hypothetical protein PHLGIDRAFT_281491 [Phlebiopsis gigantea 11061_1 CR5-6]|uniref:Uncharacterized protein n=1 Tax=Phlebiopsis gigantea (strain 11061_1 CR5-6) TaxID=745531 RepID=A0A0C3SDX5_PHLG1|nr:hypothetical protein PHLGIDRAFT_281491 [Phlebiopsis gigantea 11061_1 CR5-6]
MQRAAKQTRKVNRWNAYLHSQVEAFNQDLAPGHPRPKVHEIARGIRERWDVMTEGERVAATQDAVVELEEQRESRQTAKRESRVSTTRDIRSTLDAIEAELQDLYARTGAEILLVSVRSDVENFTAKPRIFTSSPRVADFFHTSTNRTVNEFSVKLQAYCVADVQAPIVSPTLSVQQQILEMKRKVKEVINEKLQECARPARMPRINYVDFETCITERHGIICDNWPLPNFCAPGSINSLTELEVLYRAWSTGVTTFRKLSLEEWRQFKERTLCRLPRFPRCNLKPDRALHLPQSPLQCLL